MPSRLKIRFGDIEVEYEGEEAFLKAEFPALLTAVSELHKKTDLKKPPATATGGTPVTSVKPGSSGHDSDWTKYPNVVEIKETDCRILATVTGSSKAEKTLNTAVIYLWLKSQVGVSEVPITEVRDVVKKQGCLDSANFASHIKVAKQFINLTGKNKAQTGSLSHPGKEKAVQLLAALQGS